jgi:hypothetical protein
VREWIAKSGKSKNRKIIVKTKCRVNHQTTLKTKGKLAVTWWGERPREPLCLTLKKVLALIAFIKAVAAEIQVTKLLHNRGGIKVQLPTQVTPGNDLAQAGVVAGHAQGHVVRVKIRLPAKCGMGVGDEGDGILSPLHRLGDLLDRIVGLLAEPASQIVTQRPHVFADGEITFDLADHGDFLSAMLGLAQD